jgi:hypothetical protein
MYCPDPFKSSRAFEMISNGEIEIELGTYKDGNALFMAHVARKL